MPTLHMTTLVAAPIARVYDLSRSVDLEAAALARWKLQAVEGVTTGLLDAGERVTWRGRQLGLMREHRTLMAVVRPQFFFRDVMEAGSFRRFEHDHHFATMNDGTRVRDELRFEIGWGPLGRVVEGTVRRRLLRLLEARNAMLQAVAEGDVWRRYLEGVTQREMVNG